jgi:hypothetical protein
MALIGWPSSLAKPLPTRPIKLEDFFSIFLQAVLNNYANFLSSSLVNESLEHALSAKTTGSSSNRTDFKYLPCFILTSGNPGAVVHPDWPSSWRWLAHIMQILSIGDRSTVNILTAKITGTIFFPYFRHVLWGNNEPREEIFSQLIRDQWGPYHLKPYVCHFTSQARGRPAS